MYIISTFIIILLLLYAVLVFCTFFFLFIMIVLLRYFFSLSIFFFVHSVHTILYYIILYINNYLKPNKLVVNYVNIQEFIIVIVSLERKTICV